LSGLCGDGRGGTADLKLYGVSECLDAVLNQVLHRTGYDR
jgi:hypothetical protein